MILAAGGDLRQSYAAQQLSALSGWVVEAVGVPGLTSGTGVRVCAADLHDVLAYDVLVLPTPANTDGHTVHHTADTSPLELKALFAQGKPGVLVLGGQRSETLKVHATAAGLETIDYFQREELCLGNAVPTAEGAIQVAMEHTETTLYGSRALLIGYGRIGMALAPCLDTLGMCTTVCARRCETRALAQMQDFAANPMDQLPHAAAQADVIFNTVLAMMLPESVLRGLSPGALVVDLVSRQGGTDFAAAEHLGISTVWALSLPPNTRRWHMAKSEKAEKKGGKIADRWKNCEKATKIGTISQREFQKK